MISPFVQVIQITDSHLFATEQGTLLGMNTQQSFNLVVQRIKDKHPEIDLILATGDIAQDASQAAYTRFIHQMASLNAPLRWTPGNHDDAATMGRAISHCPMVAQPFYETEHWAVILLDTSVIGKVYGEVSKEQLGLLDRLLTRFSNKPVLLTFHHHPHPMNSEWMDRIGIINAQALHAVLRRHDNVRLMLWGHVHQDRDEVIDDIRCISTPSTCVQFMPGSSRFSVDQRDPAYRWLRLYPDGQCETGLERIEGIDFEIDYSVKGY